MEWRSEAQRPGVVKKIDVKGYRSGFGFHSHANFCASAIWSRGQCRPASLSAAAIDALRWRH